MSLQSTKNIKNIGLLFTQPVSFLKKLNDKFKDILLGFNIDFPTRRFIEHNKKVWKDKVDSKSKKVILIDWHNLPVWNVPGLFFANVLAGKKGAHIESFARDPWPWARATHALYRSLNVTKHIVTSKLSADQILQRDKIYNEISSELKTKEDVFNLKVLDVPIGLDVYEGYLREFSKPTVYLDELLFATLRLAIGNLIFWEDYFESHEVTGLVISHDCYVDYNIVCRVAYKRNIPVYMPIGPHVTYLKKHHDSKNYFYSYPKWFDQFSIIEKEKAKDLSRRQLEKRFKGEVGGDLYYMKTTAFSVNNKGPRIIQPSDRVKVLICIHCFYDNPHCYGGMIFIDFYEWLKFLVRIAEKTDYDWYLKTHPNPLPGTAEIIQEILGSSSRIKIVPSDCSHNQLASEGVNFVLTVYGTVGHEYPAMGVQVINAGYNPHVGYDFTWTPKTREEYEYYLLNLKILKKEIRIEEIHEFYYMHYYYCLVEDLVYHSFRDTVLRWKREEQVSSNVYAFYLDGWNQERHQRSIARMEEFIDSGKQHLFVKGPVDVEEFRPLNAGYLS